MSPLRVVDDVGALREIGRRAVRALLSSEGGLSSRALGAAAAGCEEEPVPGHGLYGGRVGKALVEEQLAVAEEGPGGRRWRLSNLGYRVAQRLAEQERRANRSERCDGCGKQYSELGRRLVRCRTGWRIDHLCAACAQEAEGSGVG